MTVMEFMTVQARCWYDNYKHSPNFKSIFTSHKVDALIRYLSPSQCRGFKASRVNVKAILKEIEEEQNKGGEAGEEVDMVLEEEEQIGEGGNETENLELEEEIAEEEEKQLGARGEHE